MVNKTNIIHGAWAIFMQILGLWVLGNAWVGAAFAIGWFLSREYTQREYKLHLYGDYNLRWYQGFTGWSADAWFDFIIPVIAVAIVGVVVR
ncbi:MAG TPA: hypothetical protein VES38_06855 [Methylotenera sp.]|nr:hypothetical protein [Methylotenera sp.]